MSFNIGLSGLRGAQTDLSVTGNNIANASTTGFKQSRAEFGDVYNASILGTGRHSIGSGVLTERVSQQHTQGNVNYTDRALDLAINGNGYFILSNEGQREYTRAGYFDLDKDGFITNNTGKRLQGYEANLNGDIQSGALGDIQLSQTNIQPRATSRIEMEVNLDSRSEAPGGASAGASARFTSAPVTSFPNVASINPSPDDDTEFEILIGGEPVTFGFDDVAGEWVASNQVNLDGVQYDISFNGSRFTLVDAGGPRDLQAPDGAPFEIELVSNTDAFSTEPVFDPGELTAAGDTFELVEADFFAGADPVSGNWDISNFDPRDRATYTDANSTSIYDSLGNEHVLRQYYVKVDRQDEDGGEGNAWAILTSLNGTFINNDGTSSGLTEANWATAGAADKRSLVQATKFFNVQGDLQGIQEHSTANPYTTDPADREQYALSDAGFTLSMDGVVAGAGFGSNVAGEPPQFNNDINFNFRGSTQYGARFAVSSQSQDGYATGRLAGLEVDQDGIIFGRYTNGQNRPVGQVPIATFTNPEGLRPIGSTGWVETTESGIAAINMAGSGITGTVEGGALEESNVDLSEELVKMIIAQRNYQANAKTIQTQDTLTQTIINLR